MTASSACLSSVLSLVGNTALTKLLHSPQREGVEEGGRVREEGGYRGSVSKIGSNSQEDPRQSVLKWSGINALQNSDFESGGAAGQDQHPCLGLQTTPSHMP